MNSIDFLNKTIVLIVCTLDQEIFAVIFLSGTTKINNESTSTILHCKTLVNIKDW